MAKHFRIRNKIPSLKPPVTIPQEESFFRRNEVLDVNGHEDFVSSPSDPFAFAANQEDLNSKSTDRRSLDVLTKNAERKTESKGLELLAWLGAGVASLLIARFSGVGSFYFVFVPVFFILFAILLCVKAQRDEDKRNVASGRPPTVHRENAITSGLKLGSLAVGYLFLCFALIFIGVIVVLVVLH